MGPWINLVTESAPGRMAYRPVRKLIRYVRRRRNPGVPLDHATVSIRYRDKRYQIELRRYSAVDRMALRQCFEDQQYVVPEGPHSKFIETVYREIVASGKKPLIVDCGANIGASALWFHARYPEAHIVAVEPDPDNFRLLRRNLQALQADLRQAGIGVSDGVAWVAGSEMGCRTNPSGHGTEIQLLSMETLLSSKPDALYAPFFLKVDIEGAESTLFAQGDAILDRFPVIVMEPHDWMFPGERTSQQFFRFHAAAGREFAMMHENVVSVRYRAPEPDPEFEVRRVVA